MEQWIAQKRAELAKEKADFGNKENEPVARVESIPVRVSKFFDNFFEIFLDTLSTAEKPAPTSEPLLFKLGDDYQIRKAKFNNELKNEFEKTKIEKDALERIDFLESKLSF